MAFYIHIRTDNNRIRLQVGLAGNKEEETNEQSHGHRLVYREIHETEKTAMKRLEELRTYTRMQLERIVRHSNPNWLNLGLTDRKQHYHPGAKLSPNVPNFTSLR